MISRGGVGSLVRDVVALTPSYLVPGLASLVSVPILFAILGAGGYGLWALIFAIANGVPQLTTSWLESLILRFGHRRGSRVGALPYAAAGSASAIGGALLAFVFIPGSDVRVVAATAVLTLGVGGYLILIARLQSLLAFAEVSRVASIRSVTGVILSIVLAASTHDAVAAALGLAGGFAIGTVDGFARLHGRNDESTRQPAPGDVIVVDPLGAEAEPEHGEKVSYGVASGFFAVGLFVLSVGDRFVLSAVRPLADVGVYAATYSIVDLAFRLAPSVVVTTVRQRLFRAWDQGDRRRAIELLGSGVALIAWLSAWLVVVAVFVGPAGHVLPIDAGLVGPIAAGLGCFVVANALVILYSAQVRQPRAAANVVLAAALNVGLNLELDPVLGAGGAALATGLSYAAYLALNTIGLREIVAVQRPAGAVVLIVSIGTAAAAICHPTFGPLPLAGAALALTVTVPAVIRVARSAVSFGPEPAPAPSPGRDA